MRYQIAIDTEWVGTRAELNRLLLSAFETGELAKSIPGKIVYLATDEIGGNNTTVYDKELKG